MAGLIPRRPRKSGGRGPAAATSTATPVEGRSRGALFQATQIGAGSIVWHLEVVWHHDFTDEPVQILIEIGEDRYEARKVEVFRDGRLDWADESRWSPSTMLGEVPVPPLEEINEQEEFTATVISAEDFEQAWTTARGARSV